MFKHTYFLFLLGEKTFKFYYLCICTSQNRECLPKAFPITHQMCFLDYYLQASLMTQWKQKQICLPTQIISTYCIFCGRTLSQNCFICTFTTGFAAFNGSWFILKCARWTFLTRITIFHAEICTWNDLDKRKQNITMKQKENYITFIHIYIHQLLT